MLSFVNPALPGRSDVALRIGEGDLEAGLRRLIAAAGGIGIGELMFVVGKIEDRFSDLVPWSAQLEAVGDLLARLAPMLRELGVRLILKTHEEITSVEVATLVKRVGSDVLGAALDPVNSLCRVEEPVAAAQRLAGCIAQIHVDDAVLRFQERGIRRFLAPVGDGVVNWERIRALAPDAHLWIEMHSGQFLMPVFDGSWLRRQPGIALADYAALIGMAAHFGSREVPWDQASPSSRLERAYQRVLA
jgi:sugar phosphate isomerase/epimerase